jgi:hypothetical protein
MQPYLAMPAIRATLALAALIGVTTGDAGSGGAAAQGRLEAHYKLSLAGIPFGTGAWQVEVREDQFTATVTGATGGLLQLFTSGSVSTVARGSVSHGQLWAAYAS